jgi:hypothetical protein
MSSVSVENMLVPIVCLKIDDKTRYYTMMVEDHYYQKRSDENGEKWEYQKDHNINGSKVGMLCMIPLPAQVEAVTKLLLSNQNFLVHANHPGLDYIYREDYLGVQFIDAKHEGINANIIESRTGPSDYLFVVVSTRKSTFRRVRFQRIAMAHDLRTMLERMNAMKVGRK